MADASKSVLDVIKKAAGDVASNIDLSGVKLPDASANVNLGEDTKKYIQIAFALFIGYVVAKICKLF